MIAAGLREILRRPIVVAPMAGGPATPALVVAAAEAGALGFLAAGYKTPADIAAEIDAVRASTAEAFGVNLFVPGAPSAQPATVADYVGSLAGDAAELRAALGEPTWDDDGWAAKVDVLLAHPPPVVSFTFGCPPREILTELQRAGTIVAVTVTNAREAILAAAVGADCVCVQGIEAGAHRGVFANDARSLEGSEVLALMVEVARVTDLPQIAAGGIMTATALQAVLHAGAVAAQCGTAFLRCPESGAHPAHKAALGDGRFTSTALTRAFSGRPARGLMNRFMVDHPGAPAAYPEVNNATRPLRAAAARVGDTERMSLWAGSGFREATEHPAGEIVDQLDPGHRVELV
ncbi:MAG TPA: nitronate monooxygenase [Acidimicrobiales bacterium]|jgi:nitronate monooxygenase